MSDLSLAIASFPVLLVLIFLRVPIGLSMLVVGLAGSWLVYGAAAPLLNQMKTMAYGSFSTHSLSIVPLFLLMGQFASMGGMSRALFKAAEAFIGHRRGGVGMAAIGACAGFGSICGSSLATAATMGQVALPELRRAGYSGALSTGLLAAGGTLGILIPPSIVLVIYAVLAEQNIAKMFAAAFVPGILAALGYMLVISLYVRFVPASAGEVEPMPWPERWRALADVWPVALIFVVVIGGIYTGIFTPTEGAAVGAVTTGLLAWWRGGLASGQLLRAFEATASGTAMVFMIVIGAAAFNTFLALSQLPQELATWVGTQGFRALHGAVGHHRLLPDLRLRDGLAVDDPADDSDLLPDDLRARLRPVARRHGHLVRHHRPDRRRGGADHAAGGHEPLRHPVDGQGRVDPGDVPWRLALRGQRPAPGGDPGRIPDDLAVRAAVLASLDMQHASLVMQPIGVVRGGRVEATKDHWGDNRCRLELDPHRFAAEALRGLDAVSHVEVLFHFHAHADEPAETGARHPRGRADWPAVGIFAQRARMRPNRIGSSICRVLGVEGCALLVEGLDAIDGTPLLDIKPVWSGCLPRGVLIEPAWARELMRDYW